VEAWASRKDEFQRRGAFALIWALAGSDGDDGPFLRGLELIGEAATDERNFVKKSVNMALRATGKRSLPLHKAAVGIAKRLTALDSPAARWIGKDALKELESPKVIQRLRDRALRGA
jgi:3-methyladenine DNA glycosylase AlkD